MFHFNHKFVIIAGCGNFGAILAQKLTSEGTAVAILDINGKSFDKLPVEVKDLAVEADATDMDVLIDAGIKNADAVVAVTSNDNTNIMIAEIAKMIFNVKTVVVKLFDIRKETAFEGSDIWIISPALLSVNEFEKILNHDKSEVEKCM